MNCVGFDGDSVELFDFCRGLGGLEKRSVKVWVKGVNGGVCEHLDLSSCSCH